MNQLPSLSAIIIPIVAIVMALVAVLVIRSVAKLYKKVPPNKVAIVYGRRSKAADGQPSRGYRLVRGGGFFLIPVFEEVTELDLNNMPIEVQANALSADNVPVTVTAIANVKILSDDQMLPLAIERFNGKPMSEIEATARKNLEGVLRGIIAGLKVEQLISDRENFQSAITNQGKEDLQKLGLGIDLLTIQDVDDAKGYITSLGKRRTAQVVAEAAIGEAEAIREGDIKSAAARQAGEVAKAESQSAISDAHRARDEKIASNRAMVEAQNARVSIVAEQAQVEENKKLRLLGIDSEMAVAEQDTKLQDVTRRRNEAQLEATVVTTARKTAEANVVAAEGKKTAQIIAADAEREAAEREGEAQRIRATKEAQGKRSEQEEAAQGRIALAAAQQREREAQAAGDRAVALAVAAGTEAQLRADAEGVRAAGLAKADAEGALLQAQAAGIEAKAEALRKLDDAGRMFMILEALPAVLNAVGKAGSEILTPIGSAIGQGLGSIDEVRIIDMGGGDKNGNNVLSQFANLPVETMVRLREQLNASGLMPVVDAALKRAGVDVSALTQKGDKGA